MEPEFIIDEEPVVLSGDLGQAITEAIKGKFQLKNTLREKTLDYEQDLSKEKKFLLGLIEAMENRCMELIQAERRRLAEAEAACPDPEETRKWLRRVERIQEAVTDILTDYEITRFEPAGLAVPGRDEILDRDEPGLGQEPGTILRVVAPGYLWRGGVLRPAQVVVSA